MAADASLELTSAKGGTRLRLKVKAGARKNALTGVHAGALKLSVTTPPEKGKANKAVLRLLADRLELAPSAIEIVLGETSPDKTVLIPLPAETVAERLETA